jgi:hypothetical protein
MLFKTTVQTKNGGHHGYNNSIPSMRAMFLGRVKNL